MNCGVRGYIAFVAPTLCSTRDASKGFPVATVLRVDQDCGIAALHAVSTLELLATRRDSRLQATVPNHPHSLKTGLYPTS